VSSWHRCSFSSALARSCRSSAFAKRLRRSCVGDCDDNLAISPEERARRRDRSRAARTECGSFDFNRDGVVTVEEPSAVRSGREGCERPPAARPIEPNQRLVGLVAGDCTGGTFRATTAISTTHRRAGDLVASASAGFDTYLR
jgi:hypothetical protein